MITCLNCGQARAIAGEDGLECFACGYQWTYDDEQSQAARIRQMGRKPINPPTQEELPQNDPVEAELEYVDVDDGYFSEQDDLTVIDDIADKRAEALYAEEIYTIEDVATAKPADLSRILGVSPTQAIKIIASANTILNEK